MRLSDVRGDRTLDVIADLVEPVCKIASDPDVVELFKPEDLSGEEAYRTVAKQMRKALPKIIKSHKSELVEVLAIVNGEDVDAYRESLTLPRLLKEGFELITDEDLIAFLSSAEATSSASATS